MKRFVIRAAIFIGMLLGIEVVNNVVLLRLHPLGFYYTPSGLLLVTVTMTIEAITMYPIVAHQLRKLNEEWTHFLSEEKA